MLTEERQERIKQQVDRESIVQIRDLVRDFNVSESTIRRDLADLERAGRLKRLHGGAKSLRSLVDEPSLKEKRIINQTSKAMIAERATQEIEKGDVIFLDAGTTTLAMIPFMAHQAVTMVTNSVEAASMAFEYEIHTILLGGRLKQGTGAVIGSVAQAQLSNYRFQKAFMGMNAIDLHDGYMTPDIEEAEIKRQVMHSSQSNYILVDASKFNQQSFCQVEALPTATIITESLSEPLKASVQAVTTIIEVTK
ncbi:MAG: DeoR/GlpR family DNA-binding transcription regulator [Aerococcus sp.]|nr:DeoR/GlpR family DNA-binding transcription regulator [Aerococcus sp.]